jgi:hypothetical protein
MRGGDVPKEQRWAWKAIEMGPAKFHWTGIMVSLDPNPSATGLEASYPIGFVFWQAACGACVFEAIAKANDSFCIRLCDIGLKSKERVACFIGWQVQMIAPRKGFGFAQVKIRNTQKPLLWPPKRPRP